jgi:hypothetical protein
LIHPLRVPAEVALFEFGLNQDGVVSSVLPPGSVFDTATGLGSIDMNFSGAGSHFGLLFVDHEMSEGVNTWFNELGQTSIGVPPAGLSWEIDEPGFVFGDIVDNFLLGTLDNSIGTSGPEDISMALGWNFLLAADETALIRFFLTEVAPTGFYLHHSDPDSGENVFLASTLTISPGPGPGIIPEGDGRIAVATLSALALASLWRWRRRAGAGAGSSGC